MVNEATLKELQDICSTNNVQLVAVSKTKPVEAIQAAYGLGQRTFGENRAQELAEKQPALPDDIQWHMIGHLQRNKVKFITPFVHLIHSIDSKRLLKQVNKDARKHGRVIGCLLQVHIAREESKFGFDEAELIALLDSGLLDGLKNVRVCGLMGMATFTDDMDRVRAEFRGLNDLFLKVKGDYFANDTAFKELSMGMSGDYKVAMEEGSTMVRVGSLIFGEREG